MVIFNKLEGVGKKDTRKCRICGCTQFHACPGGCYWVTDDLCSQCAERLVPEEARIMGLFGDRVKNWVRNANREATVKVVGDLNDSDFGKAILDSAQTKIFIPETKK